MSHLRNVIREEIAKFAASQKSVMAAPVVKAPEVKAPEVKVAETKEPETATEESK